MKISTIIVIGSLLFGAVACETTSDSAENKKKETNEVCECAEAEQEYRKQLDAAVDDQQEAKIKSEFSSQRQTCQEMGQKMAEEYRDLEMEEMKQKFLERAGDCPAMKESLGM